MRADLLLLGALAVLGLQRIAELLYARKTAAGLKARGARAVRPDGYAAIVAVHVLFFGACLLEGTWSPFPGNGRFGPWTYVGATLFAAGEGLRYWSMHALGTRWNTRVFVLPDPLVVRGPYRFLRHPIYVGVSLELAGFALAFGLWTTMVVVSVLNFAALARRVRIEQAALSAASPDARRTSPKA